MAWLKLLEGPGMGWDTVAPETTKALKNKSLNYNI